MCERRFSGQIEAELCSSYLAGDSTQSLAERYDTERITVSKTLRRNGIVPRGAQGKKPVYLSEQDADAIVADYQAGKTQVVIARNYGTHEQRIATILKSHGVRLGLSVAEGRRTRLWKGGRIVSKAGYVSVLLPADDPLFCMASTIGYALEHRLVMARAIGRPLSHREAVHHINGVKSDNRLENLQLMRGHHGKGVVLRCRHCGSQDIQEIPLGE